MTYREEIIGDARLILGDCRDILPTLGKVDAVVTDPPYGLGDMWSGGKAKWPLHHADATSMAWDAEVPDLTPILDIARYTVIWGGHLYGLPPSRGWLVWDKIVRNFTSGHCELAWTTLDQPIQAFNYAHGQLASEGKLHPTQKPVPLMAWCLGFLAGANRILDPYMGSGSTGVACVQLGRTFIGIEREPAYFDIACRRIEEAYRQPRLFDEPAPKPVQPSLLDT